MRSVFILLLLFVAPGCSGPKVDPGLVGTWELSVPNAAGVARWVWEVHAEGTYAFHAEGPGGVPAHSGVFQANNGKYSLRSTTLLWVDSGTYQVIGGNTLSATGRLGTASWTRVEPVPPQTRTDSSATLSADAHRDKGRPGVYSASSIYASLSHHTFDDRILSAPLKVTRSVTVDPNPQDTRDGVIGIVQAEVQGSISPATISLVVYRDRAAAEAARDIYAMYDSKTFRMKPGEFVSSHGYTYRERGEATCLSRLLVHSSTKATITCYLLVQYPTREPVIIESELSQQVGPNDQEASKTAVERADDLLFAGIKQWVIAYPEIGGGDSK